MAFAGFQGIRRSNRDLRTRSKPFRSHAGRSSARESRRGQTVDCPSRFRRRANKRLPYYLCQLAVAEVIAIHPGKIKAGGVLTVGERGGFTAEGGVVNFKLEGNRVRIVINVTAAGQQKLRISSKLLSLAQIVNK
jgi:hypothetical protein